MRIQRLVEGGAIVLVVSRGLSAQAGALPPHRIGIGGGYNSATIGGSDAENVSRRSGFLVGAYVVLPANATFAFQPELFYTTKGAKITDPEEPSASASIKMAYLEIPVLGRLDLGTPGSSTRPFIYFGPAIAFKLSCDFSVDAPGFSSTTSCDDATVGNEKVKSIDYSGVIGGGLMFNFAGHAATLSARYDHSFAKISTDTDIKHRVISIVATLEFPHAR